jgi:cell division protein FtsI (penicillin-binding protein 3)
VGTIKIGQALGPSRLHDALGRFGFGRPTGVGHPAEAAGIVRPVEEWTTPDLAASAIGTHQSATALQIWGAYNVIANDGEYVQPRLVDSLVLADGTRRPVESSAPRRVISKDAADQVGRMLEEVVTGGTGSRWNLPGYSVAAKTGTSRMVAESGGTGRDAYRWADGRYHYLASFAGYLPADRPEVSITVILEDVGAGQTGSTAAGPVFSDLAKLSIRELGIAPSHLVPAAVGPASGPGATRPLVRAAPAGGASSSER